MTRSEIESILKQRTREDAAFRRRLLDDPRGTVGELLGDALPHDVEIAIFEETPQRLCLVLPPAANELSDLDLTGVAGGVAPDDRRKEEDPRMIIIDGSGNRVNPMKKPLIP